MAKYQIGVVVGSLRKDSFNNKLAHGLIKLAPADFTFKFLFKIDFILGSVGLVKGIMSTTIK